MPTRYFFPLFFRIAIVTTSYKIHSYSSWFTAEAVLKIAENNLHPYVYQHQFTSNYVRTRIPSKQETKKIGKYVQYVQYRLPSASGSFYSAISRWLEWIMRVAVDCSRIWKCRRYAGRLCHYTLYTIDRIDDKILLSRWYHTECRRRRERWYINYLRIIDIERLSGPRYGFGFAIQPYRFILEQSSHNVLSC